MSKKKRSKILAAVLCATTMAAFYASPQMVYAESLNVDNDGSVTTSTNDTKPITNLTGLEGITFGVGGELGTAGMTLYMDTSYNGLVLAKPGGEGQQLDVRGSALTVGDLYIVADDAADATDGQNRYSLRHVLGIQREGSGLEGVTRIEFGDGHGGMEVKYDSVNILDGAAIFSNAEGQTDGGTINFDGKFDSAQGMTVGNDYSLDNRGNIITSGTFNKMEIADNKVNDVTLLNGEVEADEVTAGSGSNQYKLTEVGESVSDIVNKTQGILSYDPSTGTMFNGKITAYAGVVTNNVQTTTLETTNIVSGNDSFTVHEAQETIDWVGEWGGKVSGYDGRIAQNSTDIKSLQDVTKGMSYNDSTGTTFAKNVTATDFKIGDTSLNAVAQEVNHETTGLAATNKLANDNKTNIDTINSTINNTETGLAAAHTKIGALDGRVKTAEGEIDALQSTTNDHESRITANTQNITNLTGRVGVAEDGIFTLEKKTHGFDEEGNNLTLNSITATTGTVGSVTFSGGVATGLTNISGASITVAGNTLTNGSFNGVSIADRTGGATINGISIYQDQSTQDYYVGNVNISDLTGGGSGATVEGIVRSENGEGGYITTIEENLKVNTNGEIANHNDSFKVDANGNVTATDFKVGSNSFNTAVNDLDTLEGVVGNADSGLVHDVNSLTDTVGEHTTSINSLTTTVGDEDTGLVKDVNDLQETVGDDTKGLVKDVNDLEYTVGGHTNSIKGLTDKTQHFNDKGDELTGLKNITSEKGTIGGIAFETVDGVKTIGTAADTINLAGNAITKGSFNGVNIGVDGDSHATFNGVSIYKDAQNENDVMVGGINLSDLQSGTSTKLEGIVREQNKDGNGYTTTIEGALAVNSETGDTTVNGTVTGKDFVIDDNTKLSTVAQATTGMTYTPAADGKEAVTSFDNQVKATNVTTTAGADLNALSETVNNEQTGLVTKVDALETKTTDMEYDADTKTTTFSNNLKANNFEATTGKLGDISFSGSSLGNTGDTITIAGAAITSNSFNNVDIYKQQNGDYYLGDVNVSALADGTGLNIRGITYTDGDNGKYTMNFADGVLSVSNDGTMNFGNGVFTVNADGTFGFKYNGETIGLDKLVNTVDVGTLEQVQKLNNRVEDLEDKTTGISYDEVTGSTTITDQVGTDGVKGNNSLTVGNEGITANGDTVINGDATGSGSGEPGTGTEDGNNANTVNGDQLVNGNQHVTGNSQFDGKATFGDEAGNQTVIDGGKLTTGTTTVAKDNVTADNGYFGNIVAGKGDNQTTINDDGVQVGENTSITNEGISVKDDLGGVNVGDHDVTITDSEGNVEASLSDVAQRVDGISESISDLNSRMGELEDRIDKVGAMAAAIANLRTMGYDPAAPTEIAVGIGQYRSETGAALGLFHYPNRDFMLSLSVSTSGDEVMGGIGATWKFGRKSPEKAAAEKAEKAKAAKLQKAEAIKEAARLKKVEAQQQRHAKLAAEKAAE